jgi:hypothetical protein
MSFVVLRVSRFVPVHVLLLFLFLFVLALLATHYLSGRMLAVKRRGYTVVPRTTATYRPHA